MSFKHNNQNQKKNVNKQNSVQNNSNKSIEELVIDIVNDRYNKITTTQLRLLLSNAVVIKNKISLEKDKFSDTLSKKMEDEIKYLLIKHIYQCGRDDKVKNFDEVFNISEEIKNIKNSKEKFNKFYRKLEEIVAYLKYYE